MESWSAHSRVRAPGVSNARDVGEDLRSCEWIRADVDHNFRLHTTTEPTLSIMK